MEEEEVEKGEVDVVAMFAWQLCRRDEGWKVERGEWPDTKEGERDPELETAGKYCPRLALLQTLKLSI